MKKIKVKRILSLKWKYGWIWLLLIATASYLFIWSSYQLITSKFDAIHIFVISLILCIVFVKIGFINPRKMAGKFG